MRSCVDVPAAVLAADAVALDAVAAERRFQRAEAYLTRGADSALQHALQRGGQRIVPAARRLGLVELQEEALEDVGGGDGRGRDGLVGVLEHVYG